MIKFDHLIVSIGLTILSVILILHLFPVSKTFNLNSEVQTPFIRFHLIGDFGDVSLERINNKLPCELVSNAMSNRALKYPISMILTVGDNFYAKTQEKYLNTSEIIFSSIFSQKHIKSVPWLLSYGNHDLNLGKDIGQILEQKFPFIKMPYGVWSQKFTKKNFNAVFFFLPPEIICNGNLLNKVVYKQCLMMNVTQNYTGQYKQVIEEFEKYHKDSSIDWRIVVIHYPIFSVSVHGMDSENLKYYLLPMLKKYKIDLVLAGHNHNMQYFWHSYKNTEYKEQEILNKNCLKEAKINCGNYSLSCTNKKIFCPNNKESCSKRIPLEGNKGLRKNKNTLIFNKGEEIHQVIQGAGGSFLDPICPKAKSSMVTQVFGSVQYGFNEILITKNYITIKFFDVKSEKPVLESYIFVDKIIN